VGRRRRKPIDDVDERPKGGKKLTRREREAVYTDAGGSDVPLQGRGERA